MKLMKSLLTMLVLSLILNGCSSKGGVSEEEGEGANDAYGSGGKSGAKVGKYGRGGTGGGRGGYGSGGEGAGGELDDPSSPLAKRVIYFMYNSDEVMPEYKSVISTHAAYLAAHPDQTATLEGHADERGSSEYNIALSEQRAKSVARMMNLQGVSDSQVQVVSFGEEKPSVSGHDESAWQQNRRVEINYPGH